MLRRSTSLPFVIWGVYNLGDIAGRPSRRAKVPCYSYCPRRLFEAHHVRPLTSAIAIQKPIRTGQFPPHSHAIHHAFSRTPEKKSDFESTTHLVCISLLRSVSVSALFMEGVMRSAYKTALPASCLVARPIVCSKAVSERRKPSASASRMHTRDTSGRLRPWIIDGRRGRAGHAEYRGREQWKPDIISTICQDLWNKNAQYTMPKYLRTQREEVIPPTRDAYRLK